MRIPLILILFCVLSESAFSQEYSPRFEDAQLWTSLSLNKSLSKKLDVSANGAYRLQNNYADFRSSFFQVNASYNIIKELNIGTAYRYSYRGDSEYEHIWMLKSRYKYRLKPLDVSTRFRFDYRVNESSLTRQIFRQKFQIKYRRKKKFYRPFVFYEQFYTTSYNYSNFNRYRLGLGSGFKLSKSLSLEMSYFIQSDQNQARPQDSYVLDFGLSYDL